MNNRIVVSYKDMQFGIEGNKVVAEDEILQPLADSINIVITPNDMAYYPDLAYTKAQLFVKRFKGAKIVEYTPLAYEEGVIY